uniref:protein phosphatase inhibitor 2-like n=1 Tax=Jaculus jaculus TaxID=51337 RepID=UPI001E1B4359|nr:protein phosphatase inhibitor 2-like [Jaculus jaculus]
MAASTSRHGPAKGILKNRGPGLAADEPACLAADAALGPKKSQKWDETSIQATHGPAGADCGPPAPDDGGDESPGGDAEAPRCPAGRARAREPAAPDLSPAEQEKRRQFEVKRKLHDSEGLSLRLARQLLCRDLRDDDDEPGSPGAAEGAGAGAAGTPGS